jgi:thioredoxin 1
MVETTLQLTAENFEAEVIQAGVPVLVDFWAPWCGPCRAMGPDLDAVGIENDGKAKVGKVNVDENEALSVKYGIRSIPALFLFKGGEIVDQAVGRKSKAELQALLDKHI